MNRKNPVIIIGFVLLAVAVIATVVLLIKHSSGSASGQKDPLIRSAAPLVIAEGKDSAIILSGDNFPDTGQIRITCKKIPVPIAAASSGQLTILIPVSKISAGVYDAKFTAPLNVKMGDAYTYTNNITCELDNKIVVKPFDSLRLAYRRLVKIGDPNPVKFVETVTFTGKNLDMPWIRISINGKDCAIVNASENSLTVRVPSFSAGIPNMQVELFDGQRKNYIGLATTIPRPLFKVNDKVIITNFDKKLITP